MRVGQYEIVDAVGKLDDLNSRDVIKTARIDRPGCRQIQHIITRTTVNGLRAGQISRCRIKPLRSGSAQQRINA